MNSIFYRRSIRNFIDKDVECEKIERILRAAMQAPSAHNFKPWEFIVIESEEKKTAISKLSPHATPAAKSKVSIVVLGNTKLVEKDDMWLQQDLGAAIQNMLLQIVEEGLGGVWLGFYPEMERVDKMKKYFNLPEYIIPFGVVSFGYSDEENKFIDRYDETKVSFENYSRESE
ncbi:MAG: nitroreductase family protein [Cetobacterium sp.]|uniref:nitroreductase family protein n=1 Tax=Cetobacterium sp. TaxID=2071632 RepID=UPI002FCA6C61